MSSEMFVTNSYLDWSHNTIVRIKKVDTEPYCIFLCNVLDNFDSIENKFKYD